MHEKRTREALAQATEERGRQASIANAFGVSPSTVKRWIEGGEIPPAMEKLLRLYLLGENPFDTELSISLAAALGFTPEEWRDVEAHSARAGQSPAAWLRDEILARMAYVAGGAEDKDPPRKA